MDQLEEPFVFANIAGGIGNQFLQIYNRGPDFASQNSLPLSPLRLSAI